MKIGNPPSAPASTRFPMELIENIVDQADDSATLGVLMQVSHRMYELAAPRLYTEMVVNGGTTRSDLMITTDDLEQAAKVLKSGGPSLSGPKARIPKSELLKRVQHLDIHDIPPIDVCQELKIAVESKTSLHHLAPLTISIRPAAAWTLMQSHMEHLREVHSKDSTQHPFLAFLGSLNNQHLCIQLPMMDQNLEDSLVPERRTPRSWHQISSARHGLRDMVLGKRTRDGVKDLFGFSSLQCSTMTIHNLTIVSMKSAFGGLKGSTKTLRLFFRPCNGSDGDSVEKIFDNYCYNHIGLHDHGIKDGRYKFPDEVLVASQSAEFIDMDWVRGQYDPLRDPKLSRSLDERLQGKIQCIDVDTRKSWGTKRFKMSREVEACRCCGKHQLSVSESSTRPSS